MATVEARKARGLERWAGLGGILYVVLFIGGVLLAFSGTPDGDAPPAKVIAYYRDSGHRDRINFGWAAVMFGVFFLLWFLGALRQLLRRIDDDGFLTTVATFGGAAYATLTLAGISVWAAVATMSDDTFQHRVYPGIVHAANDAGYVVHSAGGVAVGALIVATSLATMRAGLIPRWLGVLSVIVGVLAVFSVFFFPQFLVALWFLVAGFLVLRAGRRPAAAVPPAPGPAV